jgi:hypothetical protein
MNRYLLLLFFSFVLVKSNAQFFNKRQTYRIGIFTSLYLDSAYKENVYKFENEIPKSVLRGLDFVIGAQLAMDSLAKADSSRLLYYTVYDIQSKNHRIQKLQTDRVFDSLDLILTNVAGSDFKTLANITSLKNIPFISVTYPNDAGILNCPSTVILNPTIEVHCETIYNYILENDAFANMVYISKTGQQESKIKNYYDKRNKGVGNSKLLKWKEYILNDTTTIIDEINLANLLDSTKDNIIICGSLDEKFSGQLIKKCSKFKNYKISLYGMPSWESMTEMNNKDFENLIIYYSTSFYNTNPDISKKIDEIFANKTNTKPSDIVYKAYESTIYFSELLIKYGRTLASHLSESKMGIFTPYNIIPVYPLNSSSISYLENRVAYIIRQEKGIKNEMK